MTDDGADTSVNQFRAWSRPKDGYTVDDAEIRFDYLNLHRFCRVYPLHEPSDDSEIDDDDRDVDIQFLSGIARTTARNTPLLTLVAILCFFGSAELIDGVHGVSTLLPALSTAVVAGIVAGVFIWMLMFGLLISADIIGLRELYGIIFVYGQLIFLTGGTLVSIALVLRGDPANLPPNIVFTSGYLLLILLGGLYVYDGMLRTEHLFENLDQTQLIQGDRTKEIYHEKKENLRDRLNDGVPIWGEYRVPTAYVFAILLVVQFAVGWWIGVGPQNLNFSITLIGNLIINIFLVAVAFQFIILIKWMYELINDDLFGTKTLTYDPFHSDGHGGYRDLGQFATRVNLLLILGGFYCLYRLFVQGSRVTPAEMAPGFDPLIGTVLWGLSFVAPLGAYAITAIVWFYYSFWQIHRRMVREREQAYSDQTASFTTAEDWEYRNAPAWPTNTQTLFSVVTGTFSPLLAFLQLVVVV